MPARLKKSQRQSSARVGPRWPRRPFRERVQQARRLVLVAGRRSSGSGDDVVDLRQQRERDVDQRQPLEARPERLPGQGSAGARRRPGDADVVGLELEMDEAERVDRVERDQAVARQRPPVGAILEHAAQRPYRRGATAPASPTARRSRRHRASAGRPRRWRRPAGARAAWRPAPGAAPAAAGRATRARSRRGSRRSRWRGSAWCSAARRRAGPLRG